MRDPGGQGERESVCSRLLTAVDWYIIPLLNPDGYEWSQTKDRLWRKNRRPPPGNSSCAGVDLNRWTARRKPSPLLKIYL